jgi:putative heme-binding domain-containing protein
LEKAPTALAAVLQPLLAADHPDSTLVRLSVRLGLQSALPLATARAADRSLPKPERADFVRTLGQLRRADLLAPLLKMLNPDEPDAVYAAVLSALERHDNPTIAAAIVGQYPRLTPPLKIKARDVLLSRGSWSVALLTAVEKGMIPAADFRLDQIRRITLHKDPALGARVEKLWGHVRAATSREKEGRIMAVGQILAKGTGDLVRGKALITKQCLNCHELFGEGAKIGPDLTAADRKNLEVLLPNIIDPSAIIREGYEPYVVAMVDGRVLTGLLADKSPATITIVDAQGVRTTLRQNEIDTIARADSSLMPEGIIDGLTDQDLCDAFAYLRSEPSAQPPDRKPRTRG